MATELNSTLSVTIRAEMEKYMSDMKMAEKVATSGAMNTVNAYANLTQTILMLGKEVWGVMKSFADLAMKFEDGMSAVWTLTNQTRQEVVAMGRDLLRLGASTGQATDAMTKGLYDAVSAGIDVSQAIGFIKTAAETAVAGVTDVATSVDLLTSIVNSYHDALGETLSVSERAAKASDILFMTMKYGKTTIPAMAHGMGRMTSIAAQAGVSLEQVGAALATLTLAGLSTDEATTSIRQTLVSIIKPTQEAVDYARQLGIDFSMAGLKAMGLVNFLKMVKEATGGSTEKIATLFPNVRALAGVMNMAGKGAETFAMVLRENEASAGAAGVAYAKMADTSAHRLKQFKQSIENFVTETGTVITEVMAGWLRMMDEQRDAISDFSDAIQGIRQAFLWLIAVVQKVKADILKPLAAMAGAFEYARYAAVGSFLKIVEVANAMAKGLLEVIEDVLHGFQLMSRFAGIESQMLDDSVRYVTEIKRMVSENLEASRQNLELEKQRHLTDVGISKELFKQAFAAEKIGKNILDETKTKKDKKLNEAKAKTSVGSEVGKRLAAERDYAEKRRKIEFALETDTRKYIDQTTAYITKQMAARVKAVTEAIGKQKEALAGLKDSFADTEKEQKSQRESYDESRLEMEKDPKKAKKDYYRKVSGMGEGAFGKKDYEEARRLYQKAQAFYGEIAKTGDKSAKSDYERLQERISETFEAAKKVNLKEQKKVSSELEDLQAELDNIFETAKQALEIKVDTEEAMKKLSELRTVLTDMDRDVRGRAETQIEIPGTKPYLDMPEEFKSLLLPPEKPKPKPTPALPPPAPTTININITEKVDRETVRNIIIPEIQLAESRKIVTRSLIDQLRGRS